jgi:3-phenylpropionate/trans-cinnamate dioxygenase ferredoxin reductase subunit
MRAVAAPMPRPPPVTSIVGRPIAPSPSHRSRVMYRDRRGVGTEIGMGERCVVVGAGQAGLTVAQTLRERGWTDEILLLGDEAHPPYQRPPLSKKFLAGEIAADRLHLKPAAFFEKHRVDLRTGVLVEAIDRRAARLATSAGPIAYDRLVLATGTRPRRLAAAWTELPGVVHLRGIDDVERIRASLARARRLFVVGAGYIGLEVAAVARAAGRDVTVLEAQPRVLARAVAPPVSAFFETMHRSRGVRILTGLGLAAVEPRGESLAVTTADGARHDADLLLIAVGAVPNVELAAEAGLAVDDGVLVDAACRTSDDAILAAGDCTRFPSTLYGRKLRLESVQNAIDQAKAAAATLTGSPAAYDPVPWFWSDQYETKLQIVGLSTGHAEAALRGDPASGAFSTLYFDADRRLIAVDSVDRPRDHMLARRLVGRRLDAPSSALADPAVGLDVAFAP